MVARGKMAVCNCVGASFGRGVRWVEGVGIGEEWVPAFVLRQAQDERNERGSGRV